jgi:hypothetical protein
MDWIQLVQDRDQWRVFVNTVMDLQVLKKARNFLNDSRTVGLSRRT